jgi:hypothetical protein
MPAVRRPIREGIQLGLIAYAAVAAFYALFDLFAARGSLYTLNLLGRSVFRGLRDPAILQLPVAYDLPAMVLYNGLHLVASLAIGLIVAQLAFLPERRPGTGRIAAAVIAAGFFVTILGIGILSRPIRSVLPWWSIVVANTLAVMIAGWSLLRRDPGLWRRLLHEG